MIYHNPMKPAGVSISTFSLILCFAFGLSSCQDDPIIDDTSALIVEYDPSPYFLDAAPLPQPEIPSDNQLTNQGVHLGKMLFYDPILSKGEAQSCASCHVQEDGFSDINRFSTGVDGFEGGRQAMSIFNLGFQPNGFFWDGRAETLREQALMPIQDPLEMHESLDNVIIKLEQEQAYKDQFIRAFGSSEITSEKVGMALEQFMYSIISNDSKYDRFLAGEVDLTPSEQRGRQLFFNPYLPDDPEVSGAFCVICHGGPNFGSNLYRNNGLDSAEDFTDLGRFDVTGNPGDRARFRVTSLRNIAVNPPYMHDGRFETLEEVIQHYNSGIKNSPTLDQFLSTTQSTGLMLDEQEIADLVSFLHTLTDETFLNNPAYKNPF